MKAVVMAGGHGTRLRPLTSNLPKPMVPVANLPTVHHILNLLARHGISDVVLTVAFLPQLIRNYFGDGSSLGMNIEYSVEETPLGTAGSVRHAAHLLNDTFLVISGDALTDIDVGNLVSFHRERGALVTIGLVSVDNPLDFGVIIVDDHGRVQRFLEKPGWGQVFSDTVNTGIYVMEPEALDEIPRDRPYDFSHELFPLLHRRGAPLYGELCDGYWQDIGNIQQYVRANRDALDGKVELELPGVRLRGNVWVGQGVNVDSLENVEGPAVIGNYAKVDATAVIGSHTVLGNNAVVRPGAQVVGSIVGNGSYVGEGARIRGAVIGNSVDVRSSVVISEGAVIGDQCSIGESALIGNDIKVYPFKNVEPGSALRSSLVSETRGMTSLFGRQGVRGLVNVDVTPERVMRLAMSYGTLLRKDAFVTVTRDPHPASRVLKRAMVAGLTSTGISVRDLQVAPLAVNRFDLKSRSAAGGIHIRISPHHPEEVQIVFSEPPGLPIDSKTERAIENYFQREDFRRAFYDEMGSIEYPPHMLEMYVGSLVSSLDTDLIAERGFRVVMDYSFGPGAELLSSLLDRLNVEVLGVNAFAAASGGFRLDRDLPGAEEKVAHIVRVMEADMGVVMDPGGELLYLMDEEGLRLGEHELLLLLLAHECRRGTGTIVLPQQVTSQAEAVAAPCGNPVHRTRGSHGILLREAAERNALFAATADGGYVFPRFLPSMDAFMTFGKVLEMTAESGEPLSRATTAVPAAYVHRRSVPCPWHAKGAVMRLMVDELRAEAISLVDGIKVAVNDYDWVQILPDADEPLFHLYAEAAESNEAAEALLDTYGSRLEDVIGRAETARQHA